MVVIFVIMLILVNGSASYCVFFFIFRMLLIIGPSQGSALTWNIRMKVALDIARYVH